MIGDRERLLEVIREYVEHQSWRCAHPPHYYLTAEARKARVDDGDCACGLLSALQAAGIDPEPWRPREEPPSPA